MILGVVKGHSPIACLYKCDISYLWRVAVPLYLQSFLSVMATRRQPCWLAVSFYVYNAQCLITAYTTSSHNNRNKLQQQEQQSRKPSTKVTQITLAAYSPTTNFCLAGLFTVSNSECNEIYIRGEWPEDFLESVIIPIEKKSGAQECVDFRTTSLVSHASKIVLKILTRKLESKAEPYLGKVSVWFQERLWHKRCYCSNESTMWQKSWT